MKFKKKGYVTIRARFEVLIQELADLHRMPRNIFRGEFKSAMRKKGLIRDSTTELTEEQIHKINKILYQKILSLKPNNHEI